MARPPAENVAEAIMVFSQDGQFLMNKHHYLNTAGWDAGSLNNLGTALLEWWENNLQEHVPDEVSLVSIDVIDLTEGSGLGISVTEGLPSQGAGTGVPMPNNVTLAVKKGTGFIGRSFRGRTYHIGLTEAQVAGNTVDSAVLEVLRDAYDGLKEPAGMLIPIDLCVLSEWADGEQRTEGICTVVTGIGIDPTVDSQRRRLPGRGR